MLIGNTVLITQNEDLVFDDTSMLSQAVQMYFCSSIDEADSVLEDISFGNVDEDNCRAYSGAIFPAREIPKDLKGLTPYLIINNSPFNDLSFNDSFEGMFKKLPKDIDAVCKCISKTLSEDIQFETEDGVIYEACPELEDMFIFIGSKINLTLAVNPETVDEDLIDRIDFLCDAVTAGESITITEQSQDIGETDMPSKNISMTVVRTEESDLTTYKVIGRLLGACNTEEAAKIAQNPEIANKIYTGPTVGLPLVLTALTEQQAENHKAATADKKELHLVISVKTLRKAGIKAVSVQPLTKKLYISPPVAFVSESIDNDGFISASFNCTDESICSVIEAKEAT